MNDIIDSLNYLKTEKNIDRPLLVEAIKQAFMETLDKEHQDKYDVIMNADTGDLEIWKYRTIVEDGFEEDEYDISITDALKVEDDFTVGEDMGEIVDIDNLGRRFVIKFRQNIIGKIKNIDNIRKSEIYKEMIGDLIEVNVEIIRNDRFIVKDYEGNDMVMFKSDTINNEYVRKGEPVLACIKDVKMVNDRVMISLTRNSPEFLTSIFYREVPQVSDNVVDIKRVARIPGVKSIVCVDTYDDRIDPVGSCIGSNGNIIKNISRLLRGERIEIILNSDSNEVLLRRILKLSPDSNVSFNSYSGYIFIDTNNTLDGLDVKLAAKLFNTDIVIEQNNDEDVMLTEFTDEIPEGVIDVLIQLGFKTAKSVINNIDLIEEVVTEGKELLADAYSILLDEFDTEEDVEVEEN